MELADDSSDLSLPLGRLAAYQRGAGWRLGGGGNHRPPRGRIKGFKTMPLTKGAGGGGGGEMLEEGTFSR